MNDVETCGNENSFKGIAEGAVMVADQETQGVAFISQIPNPTASVKIGKPELSAIPVSCAGCCKKPVALKRPAR